MLNQLIFNKNMKEVEMMIGKDQKGKPIIYIVGPTGKKIFVKKFCGEWQYKQFLVEAVCIRLIADKKAVQKSRETYVKISKFLKDNSNEEDIL